MTAEPGHPSGGGEASRASSSLLASGWSLFVMQETTLRQRTPSLSLSVPLGISLPHK